MIKEIGSFKFMGFYESIFSSSDEFIDEEVELTDELKEKGFNTDNLDVVYEYIDFDKYKLDVCKKFMELYVDKIIDELPYDITNDKHFKFEILDDTTVVDSPKFYNYRTDNCYCQIETNYETLNSIKKHTLKLDGVDVYLRQHFTSRDGFISFISNDIDYWKALDIMDYEANMLIALLDMFLTLSNENNILNIHYGVVDCVCNYEYADPYVYFRNGQGLQKCFFYDFLDDVYCMNEIFMNE